mmetsp:Transcript_98386/g.283928  ORF Transcript_98386/g.283928 Transcript_98386/m.283928 type:complete len:200 (-) Transcript_98386:46-645(-)
MKISAALFVATLGLTQAFTVVPSGSTTTSSTSLAATVDRRAMIQGLAGAAAVAVAAPLPAFAGDYVPKVDDLKQIYFLGASLDKLVDKLSNPDTVEAGLDGVRMFNKDPNFYPGYAKNYVLKLIKKGADSDPRVGYIKQACALVSSVETVGAGGSALMDKAAVDESISRVRKAQALIAKFLAESGVKDEKIDAYIAKHK